MAQDFRLPIFDFRLNRSPHSQSKIENQKLAQEKDTIADNDVSVVKWPASTWSARQTSD
jgi:hypothetical protein